jgi:hypothetical protein
MPYVNESRKHQNTEIGFETERDLNLPGDPPFIFRKCLSTMTLSITATPSKAIEIPGMCIAGRI